MSARSTAGGTTDHTSAGGHVISITSSTVMSIAATPYQEASETMTFSFAQLDTSHRGHTILAIFPRTLTLFLLYKFAQSSIQTPAPPRTTIPSDVSRAIRLLHFAFPLALQREIEDQVNHIQKREADKKKRRKGLADSRMRLGIVPVPPLEREHRHDGRRCPPKPVSYSIRRECSPERKGEDKQPPTKSPTNAHPCSPS